MAAPELPKSSGEKRPRVKEAVTRLTEEDSKVGHQHYLPLSLHIYYLLQLLLPSAYESILVFTQIVFQNILGLLSETEVQEFYDAFKKFDHNKDGHINTNELSK